MAKTETVSRATSPFADEDRDISTAAEMEKIAAELGLAESTSVKVYVRKSVTDDSGNTKFARVWDGAPAEYDLIRIARDHGSGDYSVEMRGPGETGKHVVLAGPKLEPILLTPEEESALVRRREREPTAVIPAVPLAPTAPPLTATDVATAVVTALQATQRDPFEMLLKAKELFAPAPTVSPAPIAAPVVEKSAMEKLTDMVAGASQLKILRGIANDFAGELGDPDEVSELLGQGGSMLKNFMEIVKETRNKPAATPPAATGETIDGTATHETEEDDMNVMATAALSMLEKAAKTNKPPADMARQVATFAETEVTIKTSQGDINKTLEEIMRADDWFQVLLYFRKTLAPYQPWLTQLRAIVIQTWDAEDAAASGLTNKGKARKSS